MVMNASILDSVNNKNRTSDAPCSNPLKNPYGMQSNSHLDFSVSPRITMLDTVAYIVCPPNTIRTDRMDRLPFDATILNPVSDNYGTLVRLFRALIVMCKDEVFEEGMHSQLSQAIHATVNKYGPVALLAWENILLQYGNKYETGEEILRHYGLIEHPDSHEHRRLFLERMLQDNSNPRLREAAGTGLSYLDDDASLLALNNAYDKEDNPWLKERIWDIIESFC